EGDHEFHTDGRPENFKSSVDGKPVKVTWRESKDRSGFYVKSVHFNKGQTRIIEDSYTGGTGGDTGGNRTLVYVLETGKSWKGTIGHATIIVDTSFLRNCWPVSGLEKFHWSGNDLVWEASNLKPTRQSNIDISWQARYDNGSINGHRIWATYNGMY